MKSNQKVARLMDLNYRKRVFQVAGSRRGGEPVVESGCTGTRGGVEVHPLTPESSSKFEAEISEEKRGATT
jgi:hypothetical protein